MEDVKYSREPNLAPSLFTQRFGRFMFHFQHKTKHVRQSLTRICQSYSSVFILNIGFKIDYKASRVTDYLSRMLKTEV